MGSDLLNSINLSTEYMKFMGFFLIKYRYNDILLKKLKLFLHLVECYKRMIRCNRTFNCIGMAFVTSASRYQSRSLMYIRELIPRNWPRQSDWHIANFVLILLETSYCDKSSMV